MKKGLKKLVIGSATVALLSVPVIALTSGNGNGQEANALNGFHLNNWNDHLDDIDDHWNDCCDDDFDDRWDNDWDDRWDDDRYDFDDYLDDHYDRWDD